MSYSRGGGVSATGGVAADTRRGAAKKAGRGFPYLKIMIAIIVLILLGLAGLMLAGFRFG
jgi:flagellar basal body-associated protein FliL